MFRNKDKDKQAGRPEKSAVTSLLRRMRATESEDDDIERDDKLMYELREMPHWGQLKGFIERRKEDLIEMRQADFSEVGLDEIGLRFIVANLAVEELERIINYVEQRAEAVEKIKSEEE